MNYIYVVKADGSVYGVFSTRELADDYKQKMGTPTYSRGRWETIQYEVDSLVPKGPFKYWEAYVKQDGTLLATKESLSYEKLIPTDIATMATLHNIPVGYGNSTVSLEKAVEAAKRMATQDYNLDKFEMGSKGVYDK